MALRTANDRHFEQELANSCVAAAVRNLIYTLTGRDIPESVIRIKLGTMLGDPDYDISSYGINPRFAVNVLRAYGIDSVATKGVSLDQLETLSANGRPMLVGIQSPYSHRLMLDSVTRDDHGRRQFHWRNSKSPTGELYRVSEEQFARRYNPDAIVIIPVAVR